MLADAAFWRDLESQFRSLRDADGLAAIFSDGEWSLQGGPSDKHDRDRLRDIYQALAVRGAVASGMSSESDGLNAWLNTLRFRGTGIRQQDLAKIGNGNEITVDPGCSIKQLAEKSADLCTILETRAVASAVVSRNAGSSSLDRFRIEDLDPRLFRPLRDAVVAEMQTGSAAVIRVVSTETRQSGNAGGFWARFFDAHETLTDEWARKLYAAHCEAWRRQGQSVPPSFIRVVRDQAALPLIDVRRAIVQGEALTLARRNPARPDPAIPLGNWAKRMNSLTRKWWDSLEAEAVELEYATARASTPRSVSARGPAETATDDL